MWGIGGILRPFLSSILARDLASDLHAFTTQYGLKSSPPVQLVLSDIVMPGGMTGYDLARWLASNKPEIRVILCSGYNEGDHGGDVQSPNSDVVVLGKPYSRDQLARALSHALSPSRALF